MKNKKLIPVNGYLLTTEIKVEKEKYGSTTDYLERIPYAKVVAKSEEVDFLEVGDEILYQKFLEIPDIWVGGVNYTIVGKSSVLGKIVDK